MNKMSQSQTTDRPLEPLGRDSKNTLSVHVRLNNLETVTITYQRPCIIVFLEIMQ